MAKPRSKLKKPLTLAARPSVGYESEPGINEYSQLEDPRVVSLYPNSELDFDALSQFFAQRRQDGYVAPSSPTAPNDEQSAQGPATDVKRKQVPQGLGLRFGMQDPPGTAETEPIIPDSQGSVYADDILDMYLRTAINRDNTLGSSKYRRSLRPTIDSFYPPPPESIANFDIQATQVDDTQDEANYSDEADICQIHSERFFNLSLEERQLLVNEAFIPHVSAKAGFQDTPIMKRICHGTPLKPELDVAMSMMTQGEWVLTFKVRTALYSAMFSPMVLKDGWLTWNSQVVRSNVAIIKQLQRFLLEASMLWRVLDTDIPLRLNNVEPFVRDVFELLDILTTPSQTISKVYADTHPLKELERRRLQSWKDRWEGSSKVSMVKLEAVWEQYTCGLCDAIFGLWPAPGNALFHRDIVGQHNGVRGACGCVRRICTPDMAAERTRDFPFDYRELDAARIQSLGPFRFKATNCLSMHLIVSGHTIYYYPHWRRWSFLACHRVLRCADKVNRFGNNVSFDTLVNKGRVRNREFHYAAALLRVSQDILVTNILFFHQSALHDLSNPFCRPSRVSHFLATTLPEFERWRKKTASEKIGRRLGLDLTNTEVSELADGFVGQQSEDWGSLLDACMPFHERQVKLYKMLKEWKPKTVMEMRYQGYGGVDPVGRLAFWVGLSVGVLMIIGIVLIFVQTAASVKQFHIIQGVDG